MGTAWGIGGAPMILPADNGYKTVFGKYRCVVPKTGKAIGSLMVDVRVIDDPRYRRPILAISQLPGIPC